MHGDGFAFSFALRSRIKSIAVGSFAKAGSSPSSSGIGDITFSSRVASGEVGGDGDGNGPNTGAGGRRSLRAWSCCWCSVEVDGIGAMVSIRSFGVFPRTLLPVETIFSIYYRVFEKLHAGFSRKSQFHLVKERQKKW